MATSARPPVSAGTGFQTSSSSATKSAAPRRFIRCCRAIRRSSCPTSRSRGSSSRSTQSAPRRRGSAPAPTFVRTRSTLSLAVRRRGPRAARRARHRRNTSAHRMPRGCIAEVQPGARIIADAARACELPANFHLRNLLSTVENERDLRKAMALEQQRRDGRHIPPGSSALRVGFSTAITCAMCEQLRRFQCAVPGEQIMVILIYDDFRRDNEATAAAGAAFPRRR